MVPDPARIADTQAWLAKAANDLRAACPNAIIAHPMGILQGVDQQFTGKVERVDTELLQTLLNQGIIPVVPPLGFDGDVCTRA